MTPDNVFTEHAGQTKIEGVKLDQYGNPLGSEYDLAKDGAFKDFTVAVLHLYTGEGFDFHLPEQALKEKGFNIHRWTDVPSIKEFKEVLSKSCELWVISNRVQFLTEEHFIEIQKFFDAGYGVYILGDNEPYYVDANNVAKKLFGITMNGNVPGNKTVTQQKDQTGPGFVPHLITTGIINLYEGVTIATIDKSENLKPLLFGSDGNLVSSIYEKNGKRAIIDGGFTRLFCNWDTAGSARYVKNAAAWLANYDQWGREDHAAYERSLAGRIKKNVDSPPLFYILSKKQKITIGGFLEDSAKTKISVFDSTEKLIKEELVEGTELNFSIPGSAVGIWFAKMVILSGKKEEYTYVITARLD